MFMANAIPSTAKTPNVFGAGLAFENKGFLRFVRKTDAAQSVSKVLQSVFVGVHALWPEDTRLQALGSVELVSCRLSPSSAE